MRTVSLEEIMEFAHEEADELAKCYDRFRQKHLSCPGCQLWGFCDKIRKRVEKREAEDE